MILDDGELISGRFSYLCSYLTKDSSTVAEVSTRASNAQAAYAGLRNVKSTRYFAEVVMYHARAAVRSVL